MNSKKIFSEISSLEKKYEVIKQELESHKLLKSNLNSYIKKDKESFLVLWVKYIDFFSNLQKLIKETKYRKYFVFIDYDKIILRKYLLSYYFNVIVDLEKHFWTHMSFLIVFIEENFKRDYSFYINYIYKPDFINLINTPIVFIKPFKNLIRKEIYDLLDKSYLDTEYFNRVKVDYKNLFFYLKYWFDKSLFILARYIWLFISKIRFTARKYWLISEYNLNKYLKIAKPGDILLTRRNWNASNLSIPGFWKHMSMYIWNWKYLKKNFKYDFLENLDNKAHYIIEATWKWVNVVSISELVSHNDYLWVSRTNFKKEKILRTIKNSLENVWKWYDFRFNFHSDKNLVCSELIMKSYWKESDKDQWIEIQLEDIGVSLAYPPNNFVNMLLSFQDKEKPSVYPVFFIDSIEKTWENFVSNTDEFINSRNRSRSTLFLK